MIKIVATRCQILMLKCTKFNFGDPAGRAYSARTYLLAGLRGPTSKGRGREGGRGVEEGRDETPPLHAP